MNQSISITCYRTHLLTTFELSRIPIFSSQLAYMTHELHTGNQQNGQANFVLTKRVRTLLLCVNSISQLVISLNDRYRWVREKCYDQAFILDRLGLKDSVSKAKKTTKSTEEKDVRRRELEILLLLFLLAGECT